MNDDIAPSAGRNLNEVWLYSRTFATADDPALSDRMAPIRE